ncbi:MAG: type II toxin-antitoxin system RelE/ParE family toxin [Candidatus Igneacidithiobacillus chanchocoensis]
MVKSFRHKGLQAFYESGSKAGIQPEHAAKIARQLARLDVANTPDDVNVPGWKLHPLHGTLQGHFAVWVKGESPCSGCLFARPCANGLALAIR